MMAASGVSRGGCGAVVAGVCMIGLLQANNDSSKTTATDRVTNNFGALNMMGEGYHRVTGDQQDRINLKFTKLRRQYFSYRIPTHAAMTVLTRGRFIAGSGLPR